MNFTLYVDSEKPAVAAAIIRERALLRLQGKVYVRPYVRSWPGGFRAALRAIRKTRKYRRTAVTAIRQKAA